MSHVDAEQALVIYRHFCKQAEFAVEFLGVAKKLQNLLNVPIPSLKHVMSLKSRARTLTHSSFTQAPVSLAGALEEYLNDPNFEQNRIEYKANKDSADKSLKNGRTASKKVEQRKHFRSDHPTIKHSHGSTCISITYPGNDQSRDFFFRDPKG